MPIYKDGELRRKLAHAKAEADRDERIEKAIKDEPTQTVTPERFLELTKELGLNGDE